MGEHKKRKGLFELPRPLRYVSSTGIYHIMLRGVNRQEIFLDNQDYFKFIKELKITKEKYDYEIYAYVLMPNHVHLEIKEKENSISKIIHRVAVSYSIYFNKKYERIDHVFQDRYNSKVVESDEYLLKLMRYIHQNPEKANISKTEDYRWSSYKEYIYNNGITDKEKILNLLNSDKENAIKNFIELNRNIFDLKTDKEFLEYEISSKLTDEQLIKVIEEKIGRDKLKNIKFLNKTYREEILKQIGKIEGASKIQISNILEIDRKTIL